MLGVTNKVHRANAYAALAEALRRWSELPVTDLVGRVNKPAEVTEVAIQGEILAIELTASWADEKKLSVRIEAIANGPSHWRMERLTERLLVPISERTS